LTQWPRRGYSGNSPAEGWSQLLMMLLSRSFGRKIVATGTAAVAFAFLYEVTILDSRYAARQAELRETTAIPAPGTKLRFTATAYCRGTTTASGVNVRNGIAAADPDLLPVGSVLQIDRLGDRYNGIYTVMDTGPAVQGRHIDIYMWNCDEARYEFGRRSAGITVLRLGWNPRASSPRLIDHLFRQREAAQPPPGIPPAAPTTPAVAPAVKEAAPKEPGG
jgi:3D (Asp-Asp-Asp) domain-containing protein